MNHRAIADLCAADYGTGRQSWIWESVQASFHVIDGECLVIFRGTEIHAPAESRWHFVKDVGRDLRAAPWPDMKYGTGFWHAGFYKGVLPLIDDIAGALTAFPGPRTLAGHSKGGAEATIAARILLAIGIRINELVTFGAPSVGGTPISTQFTRYVHGNDPVPNLPPWLWHLAPATVLGVRDSQTWDAGDHGMANYCAALELPRAA